MSEQVTVNAKWLYDFACDYHSLDETVEELFQRHHHLREQLAEARAENQRLREARDGLVSALHTGTSRVLDEAIDVAEKALTGEGGE